MKILKFVILLVYLSPAAGAKPLIVSSEKTTVSVCINYDDTNERLLEICAKALMEAQLTTSQRAKMLTVQADAHRWLGQYEQARTKYREALSVDPNFAGAHEGLGWIEWSADLYSDAIGHFQDAMNIAPNSETLGGLASSLYRSDQISLDDAFQYFEAALAMEPGNSWVLREMGWNLYNGGHYERAEGFFIQAIEISEDDANAHEGLALVYVELDESARALEHINTAIAADLDEPEYILHRAMVLLEMDRPAASLSDAESYIEKVADDPMGYVREARALHALGRTVEALSVISEARARLSQSDILDYWYAQILSKDGQQHKAWEIISYHLEEGFGDYWDYELLAYLSIGTDQFDAASEAVKHLKRVAPDEPNTGYWDAVTSVYLGNLDDAEAKLRLAVQQGLEENMIGYFVEHMVSQGHFLRATAFRFTLSRERIAQEDVTSKVTE